MNAAEDGYRKQVDDARASYNDQLKRPVQTALDHIKIIRESLTSSAESGDIAESLTFISTTLGSSFEVNPFGPLEDAFDTTFQLPLAIYYPRDHIEEINKLLLNPPSAASFSLDKWNPYVQRLTTLTRGLLESARHSAKGDRHFYASIAAESIQVLVDREQVRLRLGELDEAAQKANQTVQDIEEAAGHVAEGELSLHFSSYEKSEKRAANISRYAVIAIVVAATVFVFYSLNSTDSGFTWLDLAKKVSIIVPAVALAAYLARESTRHRENSTWAATISVQLKTIKAYTDSLSSESRESIRSEFGSRIFTQRSPRHDLSSQGPSATLLTELRDLLALQRS